MRTEFLCIYVLRVASGPRVKLASCKSALNTPVVCSTDRSKAVVPVLVLLLVALWFILRGDLLYVFPCVILFLCFSVLLVLRLPRLGKRELQQGISEPEFYGDLVYRFRKIVGKSNFSEQFRKLINRYKRIGFSLDIKRQTAYLVVHFIGQT